MLQLTGIDISRCPLCQKGTLVFFTNLPILAYGILLDDPSNERKTACFALLCTRAHASVRPVSLLYLLWADSCIAFR